MEPQTKDIFILRKLAQQVMEAAAHPKYREYMRLWTEHNSMKYTRPLVLVTCGRYDAGEYEIIKCECENPLYRNIEFQLRNKLLKNWVDDDSILYPWVTVNAVFSDPGWGIHSTHKPSLQGKEGAYKLAAEPAITPNDKVRQKMRIPLHAIDEKETRDSVAKISEAVGDIIPVHEDRTTPYINFGGDISYYLGQFLGIERMMMHMCDNPEWLHELLSFLRDGILSVQGEAEKRGDFTSISQYNQAEPYAYETVVPSAKGGRVERRQLWGFFAAQEFAGISPAMHEEFLFRYQLPIMENFGLIAYGCCEDLSRKIDILRQLKNLRRIAVSPWADISVCARQIEDRYVLSWRPNPSDMVCSGFNPERIGITLREGLKKCAGCHVDIILKDIQTVQGEPERLRNWARIAKDVASGKEFS